MSGCIRTESPQRLCSAMLLGLCYVSEIATLAYRSSISKTEEGQYPLAYCNHRVTWVGFAQAGLNGGCFALLLVINKCDSILCKRVQKCLTCVDIIFNSAFLSLIILTTIHAIGMFLNQHCSGYFAQPLIDLFGYLTLRFGWASMHGAQRNSTTLCSFWFGVLAHTLFFATITTRVILGHLRHSDTQSEFDSTLSVLISVVEEILIVELVHALCAAKPGNEPTGTNREEYELHDIEQ